MLKNSSSLDKIVVLNKTGKRISLPPKFSMKRYNRKLMRKMTAWDWAFQFAIRRSCWNAVESLTAEKQRGKDNRNFQERREDINRLYRTDRAIKMILSNPIVSRNTFKEFGLEESNFWYISYLFDNTISGSPAISIPTLDELERHARRARYVASTEPNRSILSEYDEEVGEMVDVLSVSDVGPDYVKTDALLDGDPLILCVRTGNTPGALKKEFGLFIDSHVFRRNRRGSNPNELKISEFADLYLLAYIDLKIWTSYQPQAFYGPTDVAWIISDKNINDATVSKRIAPLADQLLDNQSRKSQELLRLAAVHRNAGELPKKSVKRGRRSEKR